MKENSNNFQGKRINDKLLMNMNIFPVLKKYILMTQVKKFILLFSWSVVHQYSRKLRKYLKE